MALSKKIKEQAKALKIPYYWNYGETKLKELIESKKPKVTTRPVAKTKPTTKTTVKKSEPVVKVKKENNKAEILDYISKCNALIRKERKAIKGPKAQYYYSMLDRSLSSLKDVTTYLSKIQ